MVGFRELYNLIETRKAHLVVIGLGYVGLPVAGQFAQAGFKVTGLDVNAHKVATVNAGGCPIEGKEPGLAELIDEVVTTGGLRATSDYAVCREADVILIAVETPIDSINQPRYSALRSVLRTLEPNIPPRDVPQLVIVESTVAPGTMPVGLWR